MVQDFKERVEKIVNRLQDFEDRSINKYVGANPRHRVLGSIPIKKVQFLPPSSQIII